MNAVPTPLHPRSYGERLARTAASSTRSQPPSGSQAVNLSVWLGREYEMFTDGLSGPAIASIRVSAPVEHTSAANNIEAFKQRSGLTWDQVARLFGVSKRAVLLWRAGGSMSVRHEERLATLTAQLAEFDTNDHEQTRTRLLTVRDGMAPYQRWQEQARRPGSARAWIDRQPEA